MNAKNLYYTLFGGLVCLILITGLTVYAGTSLMQKSANSLVDAKLDNLEVDTQEISFVQAKKDLEKYKDISALVSKVLPKDKDQARAVSEIYRIGSESNITIDRIQFPSSTLGVKTATPSGGSSSSASSPAATAGITQAKAVDGLKSVLGIDVEISSAKDMKYNDMVTFLQKIESNRRSMQIKKISVRPDLDKKVLSFELTVTIFVKP